MLSIALLGGALTIGAPPAGASSAQPVVGEITSRPDAVSAILAAKSVGHRVEITGDETATTTTYANPDGTQTTEDAAGPIRVQNADGSWSSLDLDLVANADGTYSATATPGDLTVSGGGNKTLAALSDGDGRQFGLGWASKLPAPTIKGGLATYQLDSTTQLVVASTALGFNVHVVLSAPPTVAPTFRLPLVLKKLAVSKAGDGTLAVSDAGSGKTAWRSQPFVMWDASTDGAGNPTNVQRVGYTVASSAAGQQEIDLSPAMSFLTDPSTVYPVTIDPNVVAGGLGSTYVYGSGGTGNTTSEWTDYKLPVGTFTPNAYTSFLDFDTSAVAGKHLLSATLSLHEYQSGTSLGTLDAYPTTTTPTSLTVFSNAPAYNTSATYSASKLILGAAPLTASVDVTTMTQAWASGTLPNDGIALVARTTGAAGQRTFCSMNPSAGTSCTSAANEPSLSITYQADPGVPTGLSVSPSIMGDSGVLQVATLTPTLTMTPQDADGGSVNVNIEVDYDPSYYTSGYPGGGSGVVSQVNNAPATAGSPYSYTLSSSLGLTQGARLVWKAQTVAGTLSSAWSTPQQFEIDTVRPPLPTVSCDGITPNAWQLYPIGGFTATCTVSDTGSDVSGYVYGFNTPTPTTHLASGAGIGVPNLGDGWFTFDAQAINSAGVYSGLYQFGFGLGYGGLATPVDQQTTQQAVVLSGGAAPTEMYVRYKYRIGTTGAWADVPTEDITLTGSGGTIDSWPYALGDSAVPDMAWNVAQTVGSDGPVQVEGCYYNHLVHLDGCSDPRTLLLDRTSFNGVNDTEPLGPGELATGTGDFAVGTTDASIATPFDTLSFGRTLTTLDPATTTTGATGVLGPGWRLSLPGPDLTGASDLTPSSVQPGAGYATLTDELGATYSYVTTDAGYPYTFTGLGVAADGSILTEPNSTTLQLKDPDGTVTAWTLTGTSWQLSSMTEPGAHATTYSFDTFGRVTKAVAPAATGITGCAGATPPAGCRVLNFVYATSTTATGYTSSGWGTYEDALSQVTYTAYDPVSSAMSTVAVADYSYDPSGYLRAEWDPRISPVLKTTYSYNTSTDQLITLTPPGINPWTLSYDDSGRLASVSQTDPVNGTATQAVAYAVPTTTGPGGPVDLSPATTATWGQNTDLPYGTGTAIFPADHIPHSDGDGGYAPYSNDWPYATLYFGDVNGRNVNTAQYGAGTWLIGSTRYDAQGNVVWALSPGNRAQALSPTSDTDPAVAAVTDSAQRGNALATTYDYTDDGTTDGRDVDLTDIYGPVSPTIRESNGTLVDAQTHTHNTFDEGAPAGSTLYHLVTTTTTAAYYNSGGSGPADYDTRTTRLGYDPTSVAYGSGWTFRVPTVQAVVVPGGSNIVTKTAYNLDGEVVQSRMPKADAAGDDTYTTNTDYYSAAADSAHPECGGHPGWAGLACWTGPASQPTGQTVPTTEATYNYFSEPTAVTQTSGTATRTTTMGYDAAGRETSAAVNDSSPGVTAVPAVTYGYNTSTGLPTTTSTSSQTVTAGYDALGRMTTYTVPAATGTNTSTATYDIDGHTTSINDGKGTYTYTYNGLDSLGRAEHRGLVTAENAGMGSNPSTFAAAYDADGNMVGESYPAGVVATSHYDNNDQLTSLSYNVGGGTTLPFVQRTNAFGEIRTQTSVESNQVFIYDAAGRLSQTADYGDGTCVTRQYGYDSDTNRTSLTTYPPSSGTTCSTSTTPTTSNWTHDSADRVTNTGYSYDPMGRTLTVPRSDTSIPSGSGLTLTYFANDMVHTENDGTNTDTFTLDPDSRIFSTAATSNGKTLTDIYASGGDSPAWIASSDGTWSRNVTDIAGNLAATETSTTAGQATLKLVNPQGDAVATLTDPSTGSATLSQYFETTEFGAPRQTSPPAPDPYTWLGGKLRNSGDLGGLVLMGDRLYDPYSGRFESVDPVPGGSSNAYDYCGQDPVNNLDLSGKSTKHKGETVLKIDKGVVKVLYSTVKFFSAQPLLMSLASHSHSGLGTNFLTELAKGRLGEAAKTLAKASGLSADQVVADILAPEVTLYATLATLVVSLFDVEAHAGTGPPAICACDGPPGIHLGGGRGGGGTHGPVFEA